MNLHHSLCSQLICRACVEHPHHTLFIIFALVNADKDKSYCKSRPARGAAQQPSQFDLVRTCSRDPPEFLSPGREKSGIAIKREFHHFSTCSVR